MYILIDRNGAASLIEPEIFTAFKLVSELPADALASALGPVGALKDAHHVWVSEAWVRAQGAHLGEDWSTKLEGMLAYAAKKDWLQEGTGAILAHIE